MRTHKERPGIDEQDREKVCDEAEEQELVHGAGVWSGVCGFPR